MTSAWDGLVVMCAGTSWDGVWFPDKHIASRLTDYAPVLYVDPPMSVLTPLRSPALRSSLREPRLRVLGPRLARLTPLTVPGISRPVLRDVAEQATRRALARAVKTLGGSVHAVVAASLADVFDVCSEHLRVLYGTDDFAAGGSLMHLPDGWLARRESARLAQADLVLAVSPPLAERWAASGWAVDLLPNGCDHTAYASTDEAQLPSDVRLPQPLAVFVGHLSERIDLLMLEAVAQTGASLLLVGPRQRTFAINRLDALLARPNVQWVGPKPFEELPGYLRLAKVGLTPYADSAFNRGSFPLKTLEYLAAGRAAVVSDLPSVRWLDTDLVTVAGTPEDFARATTEALQAADSPVLARHRRCFAAEHSWDRRTRDFAQLLQLDVGSRA